jgi:hypothetical protein
MIEPLCTGDRQTCKGPWLDLATALALARSI